MKSFQAARNANSPTVINPGRTAGSMIRRRTSNVPAPSTSADSSSSLGTASNEIRIMKVANGSWNSVSTSATPSSEFCSPRALSSTYSGISSVPYGTMRIAERQQEQHVPAGKREPGERIAAEERDAQGQRRP